MFTSPLVEEWFASRYGAPTDIQSRSWPFIAKGEHVLIAAPTGSGKTLTAFLPAIDRFISGFWPTGEVSVLYVSPLKALNVDIWKNLIRPLEEISDLGAKNCMPVPQVRVLTRSGDTLASERQRMLKHPPEILITTPESLALLLNSPRGSSMLSRVRMVILDEIHAVAGEKRGTFLMCSVERLASIAGEFQRIVASATVRPLTLVADFAFGSFLEKTHDGLRLRKRGYRIVESNMQREISLVISATERNRNTEEPQTVWPNLIERFKEIIKKNRSTIIFSNSRRQTEKITYYLNEHEERELAYSHHGSLSKEVRTVVEERLKAGELPAIVATASLELGIDIGTLDEVLLCGTPPTVSQTIQRIGRAGHAVGGSSRGTLFPLHGKDFLFAAAMAEAVKERDIEEIRIVDAPLDVLSQEILGITAFREYSLDELFAFITSIYSYRNLTRRNFDLVIDMLAGKYSGSRIRELDPLLSVDRLAGTVRAKEGVLQLLYRSGGTIPDRGSYTLRLAKDNSRIGELDEEFVWERKIGDTFTLGTQCWKIASMDAQSVYVVPWEKHINIIPFWRAENQYRDFHFSERILAFLDRWGERFSSEAGYEEFMRVMAEEYRMDEAAADNLYSFLRRQEDATGCGLPGRHRVVIEAYRDPIRQGEGTAVILHTLWGGGVNLPLSLALSAIWAESSGMEPEVFSDNDCIVLVLSDPDPDASAHVADTLRSIADCRNFPSLLQQRLESSGFFGALFRENAGRALLLPKPGFGKRMPLFWTRIRSKKLLDAVMEYPDFPMLIETWRTAFHDYFDMESVSLVLSEIGRGEIELAVCDTVIPSPFSQSVIFQSTGSYIYQGDELGKAKVSNLRSDIVKEAVQSSYIRPELDPLLVSEWVKKLKRLVPGYVPDSAEELVEWVKERVVIPHPEWLVLAEMIDEELRQSFAIDSYIRSRIVLARFVAPSADRHASGEKMYFVVATENLPRVCEAFGLTATEIPLFDIADTSRDPSALLSQEERSNISEALSSLDEEEQEGWALSSLLCEVLRFEGPLSYQDLAALLPVRLEDLDAALASLISEEQVVPDVLLKESGVQRICDAGNLEILLRISRRRARPFVVARPLEDLALFIATVQGLLSPAHSVEGLKHVLDSLFGYPLDAGLWETDVFPARLSPYYTALLDSLFSEGRILWFGCGGEKLSFCFKEDYELFKDAAELKSSTASSLLKGAGGSYDFFGLREFCSSFDDCMNRLWSDVWNGVLSCDSYSPVRTGLLAGFSFGLNAFDEPDWNAPYRERRRAARSAASRWRSLSSFTGRWFSLSLPDDDYDEIDCEEIRKDRVRQLLARYGIIFREILSRELPLLHYSEVSRTLRIMELSGEIISGHFFDSIDGPQFMTPYSLAILENLRSDMPVFWMNAADPASLCGLGIQGFPFKLPPRISTNHVVFKGSLPVVFSRRLGKELDFICKPDDPDLPTYFSFLDVLVSRSFSPLSSVKVELINGEPAAKSPYAPPLLESGFQKDYKGLSFRGRNSG